MKLEGTLHPADPADSLQSVPDDELLRRLGELVSRSRRVEVDLVAHVGEVDERRLYAREASASMFAYCTQALHLSEAEAYLRIRVARASREHPLLLTMLGDGRLHLSGIAKLVPILTRENRDALLKRATHRSKRQILELVAELSPRPDVPSVMRKLPQTQPVPVTGAPLGSNHVKHAAELGPDAVGTAQTTDAGSGWRPPAAGLFEPGPGRVETSPEAPTTLDLDRAPGGSFELGPDAVAAAPTTTTRQAGVSSVPPSPPSRPAVVEPLSAARYKVQFTASAQLHDKLERLQALMRSEVPDGDLAAIIEQAVTEKLERIEARRYARTSAPHKELEDTDISPASRHIPAAVRRAVRERDGDRCGYVDKRGQRCSERDRLEFHHRHPFAMGGDHSPANLRLLCSTHNRYLAEHDYGRRAIRGRSAGASARSGLLPAENRTLPLT